MPRKTKEIPEIENEVKKKASTKKATTKKSPSKSTSTKVVSDKKATKTKASAKTASDKKVAKTKASTKTASDKKVATKKASTKTASDKKVATKKASTKTASVKKVTRKSTGKKTTQKLDVVEYYDLPYRYNQTVVKVLAQTPTTLFIYWDISDDDRENYKKQFGENFFETTRPILKIYNDTMNYSFEVDINDFANSWYLHIKDAKCDYRVELGRRPIYNPADIGGNEYVYISTSNEIEVPNNRILIDKAQNMVYFRNVKTNQIIGKSFSSFSFLRNMGKIYNIYDLYKELYKDEDLDDIYNPSSRFL